jgi:hypothetical protein
MEIKNVHFWCTTDRADYALPAILRPVNSRIGEAWCATCPDCDKTLYRLKAENAKEDPYFRQSKYMTRQVRKHRDALMQPGDKNFNLLNPQHEKQRLERENDFERKTFEDIQDKYHGT